MKYVNNIFLLLLAAALAACNGSSSSGGNGALTLAVADTPIDSATHVTVVFTGVEVQPADGMGDNGKPLEFDFSTPKTVDLLDQQQGRSAVLLDGVSLAAGDYAWIRLKIDVGQSSITLTDGSVHPLRIPSGDQTGLKLVSGFAVAAGNTTSFTVDFNLRQAVVLASGTYMLKPALRIVDNLQVGTLVGSVANTVTIGGVAISDPSCGPAVYIYSGSNVTPVDINTTSAVQPLTTATLTLDATTGKYDYSEGFLQAGNYTVALVCAAKDDPATADALTFSATKDATVSANTVTTVDFP